MWATLRQRNFALLWFAGLVSYTGNWMLWIALPVVVYELTESAFAVSMMLVAGTLPSILFGSVAGVFVDRWDRKRTMVIANLLLAASVMPLLLVRSADLLWLVFIARFVQSTLSQFFTPAEGAMLPLLVDKQYLVSANALNSLNNNLARLIGPAIGGAVVVVAGLAGVVILDALTYVIAGVLILFINITSKPETENLPVDIGQTLAKVKQDWLDGMRVIRLHPVVRTLFIGGAIMAIGEGVISTMLVPFVTDVLHAEAFQLGWLMSAQAVGGLLGGVVISRIGVRVQPQRLLAIGAILFGVIDLIIFNYPAFIPGILVALILLVVVGIPAVAIGAGLDTLLQTSVEDRYRGRVLGAFGTVFALFSTFGMIFSGTAADSLGIVPVINIQGYAYLIVGFFFLLMLGGQAGKVFSKAEPQS